MTADILTKSLHKETHRRHIHSLGLVNLTGLADSAGDSAGLVASASMGYSAGLTDSASLGYLASLMGSGVMNRDIY